MFCQESIVSALISDQAVAGAKQPLHTSWSCASPAALPHRRIERVWWCIAGHHKTTGEDDGKLEPRRANGASD